MASAYQVDEITKRYLVHSFRDETDEYLAMVHNAAKAGDPDALEEACILHTGLVERRACRAYRRLSKIQRRSISLDDIRQVGRIGLIEALRRYDPAKAKLSTFSFPWINGEIGRLIRDTGTTVRPCEAVLQAVHRKDPTLKSSLRDAAKNAFSYVDIDDMELEATREEAIDRTAELRRVVVGLAKLGVLGPVDVAVLTYRYFSPFNEEITIRELAQKLGVSFQRVAQRERMSLSKVRRAVRWIGCREVSGEERGRDPAGDAA
jgi:RNA polymerase sigma factor (sigma-70 family)